MAGKNLIISRNPAPRKKRRSAAQKAASKRNIKKAQAANRGGRRRAPAKRRRTSTKRRSYKRRSNPARLPTFQSVINNQVMPALVGGTGAVANDMIVNLLPLPAQFKSGWMRHVSKAVGAVAIGMLGGFILPKKTADQLGAGAMTVVGYNVVRDVAARFVPQLPLGEYLDPMGEYLDPTLGYYGAGLNPETIPGSGLSTSDQFTRGSPYMGDDLAAWPTGSAYEDLEF